MARSTERSKERKKADEIQDDERNTQLKEIER